MSHNLYQLKTEAPVGSYVTFAGVWDTYGRVIKHQDSGYHLIRGLGTKPPKEAKTFHRTIVDLT